MQTTQTLATAAALLMGAACAQAALIDRGGGLIYDTELNITWLQDFNYARTSGYAEANQGGAGTDRVNPGGNMGWNAANTWANNLVFGGFDDWRLPTMLDTGAAGCDSSNAGGTDCGYNVQTKSGSTVYSELAHLWYVTLGNLAYCAPGDADCLDSQPGFGLTNRGPFTNFLSNGYWTGLQETTVTNLAWRFAASDGFQSSVNTRFFTLYAVAVRSGDVAAAVPEPQTLALVMGAFGAAMLARRKRPA